VGGEKTFFQSRESCKSYQITSKFGEAGEQMKETIKPLNLGDEFYTPERCYITEVSNTPDDPDASITRARVEPGVTTRWHRLKGTTERYYIVRGRGRVEVGKITPQEVKAGDVVLIPPMCRQRITNIGSEDLIFLAICTPRFSNDVYEDIENESTA
jgi:mannose-6-phosphate isomerase-like protein (cupin superfamily)